VGVLSGTWWVIGRASPFAPVSFPERLFLPAGPFRRAETVTDKPEKTITWHREP
jgi:hypothetical protein